MSGGRYRSIAKGILSYTAVGFVLSYPRAALLCANAAQIGFVEANESGLVQRDTEVAISSMDTWKLPTRQPRLRS